MATTTIIRNAKYYDTVERLGEHENTCVLCGKRIAFVKYWLHMTTDAEFTTEKECENSQGFFPVGNDCAKKLQPEFLHQS